jgi:hypothetical protein
MTVRTIALIALLAAATLGGCDAKQDPVQHHAIADAGGPVTWCEIGPIVTTVCTQCHSAYLQGSDRNGSPPEIDLNTYLEMLDNLDRGNVNIQAGTMPPTGGLPQSDRDLFQQWVDQGSPACSN